MHFIPNANIHAESIIVNKYPFRSSNIAISIGIFFLKIEPPQTTAALKICRNDTLQINSQTLKSASDTATLDVVYFMNNRMSSQPVESILGEPLPLQSGVKTIASIDIPRSNSDVAAKGVVCRRNIAAAPLDARIETNLPDRINNNTIFLENYRIVTVEKTTRVRLVR